MDNNQTKIETLFSHLWQDYITLNPQVAKIHALIETHGGKITNDHIAFRTFGIDGIRLEDLARHFLDLGYTYGDSYHFAAKKLKARHLNAPSAALPKVFISELILNECSEKLVDVVKAVVSQIDPDLFGTSDFLWSGRPWSPISFQVYDFLRQESEYAAWMYVFGFRANHFTVNINQLARIDDIESLNQLLVDHGVALNTSGGEIKGGPSVYLSQSATVADKVAVEFVEGPSSVPSCFYEFALRHRMPSGELFGGFVADNADKIFESTNAG